MLLMSAFRCGFNHFVTSIVAPVASGWSGCRVGLSPTGKSAAFARRTLEADILVCPRKRRTNYRSIRELSAV